MLFAMHLDEGAFLLHPMTTFNVIIRDRCQLSRGSASGAKQRTPRNRQKPPPARVPKTLQIDLKEALGRMGAWTYRQRFKKSIHAVS